MTRLRASSMLLTTGLLLASVAPRAFTATPTLTFEDRVAAQEAIERVYYSHQIGATKPFEEAVPRKVLEAKVHRYLKQSVALEQVWKSPVTGDMLRAELGRIARNTRFPERLQEVAAALGNDPLLLEDCFARSTLTERLTRDLFSFDRHLHAASRAEAETLYDRLVRGELDINDPEPRRTVVTMRRIASEVTAPTDAPLHPSPAPDPGLWTIALPPDEYDRVRSRFPEEVGMVGRVMESRDAFSVSALLEDTSGSMQIAIYRVRKAESEAWWKEAQDDFDESTVRSVADLNQRLPVPSRGRQGFSLDGNLEPATGIQTPPVLETAASVSCPSDDVWDNGLLDSFPSARSLHTAVWTGSVMIVWGGSDGGYLNTGGRYDAVTDNWTATSTVAAPSKRYGHTAVWTGSQMIVWGGSDGSDLDTGGRYDPVADTWTATSTAGAPSERDAHTAVWTGTEMIVWGGFVNTGGRYDPVTDTWSPTSTAVAPFGRGYSTAVWTGTEMIVWGGYDAGYYVNTGGRYDPVTDTWTITPIDGAPSGRLYHTAVWTGSHMIVWGGNDPTPADTGGRYDPLTNTWAPTSIDRAPLRRTHHTAVWTGTEMIVWGGLGNYQGHRVNTGGRYAPLTDAWTATTTADAPSGRAFHTAVATGHEMIVWGGWDGSDASTGGRYLFLELVDRDADGVSFCYGDCDESDPSVHPGAAEICDGLDNDCNSLADDADSDGDALGDCMDNCPSVVNPGQSDGDEDGVGNTCDNCPAVTNADQADLDADGIGDACDTCLYIWDPVGEDSDDDGFGNACDNCEMRSNPDQRDTDDDNTGTSATTAPLGTTRPNMTGTPTGSVTSATTASSTRIRRR